MLVIKFKVLKNNTKQIQKLEALNKNNIIKNKNKNIYNNKDKKSSFEHKNYTKINKINSNLTSIIPQTINSII